MATGLWYSFPFPKYEFDENNDICQKIIAMENDFVFLAGTQSEHGKDINLVKKNKKVLTKIQQLIASKEQYCTIKKP